MSVTVRSPAKVILCGEHAVVYGVPAIAFPVYGLMSQAVVIPHDGAFRIRAEATQEILSLSDFTHPLIALAAAFAQQTGISLPNVEVVLTSEIPVASGLGSGASIAATLVKALNRYCQTGLDLAALNNLVFESEKHFHGTPSGIDNTTVVYGQPVYFVKGQAPQPVRFQGEYYLLIANTGITANTMLTVAAVRQRYEADRITVQHTLDQIGALVIQARTALESGDGVTLGGLLTENHGHLQQLGVSLPLLDDLVSAALAAGALGAKLSGGGGGGNMIALVTPETHEAVKVALSSTGAVQVVETRLTPTEANR
ncbi:MAG: mevalonate kinase [Phototrophicaceae bacterium]